MGSPTTILQSLKRYSFSAFWIDVHTPIQQTLSPTSTRVFSPSPDPQGAFYPVFSPHQAQPGHIGPIMYYLACVACSSLWWPAVAGPAVPTLCCPAVPWAWSPEEEMTVTQNKTCPVSLTSLRAHAKVFRSRQPPSPAGHEEPLQRW